MIKKIFSTVVKALDPDNGIYQAKISTEAPDRGGDIVRAAGAQLENYMLNPVVMYAHDYSDLPVAKALDVQIFPGDSVDATFQFPEWGISEKSDTVRRLWQGGFLNAVSIGFQPTAYQPIKGGGYEYTEWEMLEFSIVPVPMNAEALRLALKAIVQQEQEGTPDSDDATAEPNTDQTPHDASETIAAALQDFFETLSIKLTKE